MKWRARCSRMKNLIHRECSRSCVSVYISRRCREPFDVVMTMIGPPEEEEGGGPTAPKRPKAMGKYVTNPEQLTAEEFLRRKKGIIELEKIAGFPEGFCLPISLFVAKRRQEGVSVCALKAMAKAKIIFQAKEYLRKARITPTAMMGLEELRSLCEIEDLREFNVSLYNLNGERQFSKRFSDAKGELFLLLACGKFSVLSHPKVLTNTRRFCLECT